MFKYRYELENKNDDDELIKTLIRTHFEDWQGRRVRFEDICDYHYENMTVKITLKNQSNAENFHWDYINKRD